MPQEQNKTSNCTKHPISCTFLTSHCQQRTW